MMSGQAPAESEIQMNTHPYLRAFMAGILVPTLVLPLLLMGMSLPVNLPFYNYSHSVNPIASKLG